MSIFFFERHKMFSFKTLFHIEQKINYKTTSEQFLSS